MSREMVVIAKEKYEDLMKRIEGKNVDNQTGGQEQTANKKEEHHRAVEKNTEEIPTEASDVDKEEEMKFDSVDSKERPMQVTTTPSMFLQRLHGKEKSKKKADKWLRFKM